MSNQTIIADTLMLEITRRCNMCCEHCLRGPAQNMDMSDAIIRQSLQHIQQVNNITFTGGEPSLYPHAMKVALDYCKQHHIPVYGMYVVTNGKEISDEFMHILLDWQLYMKPYALEEYGPDETYASGISLSKDIWHEEIPEENIELLKIFSNFRHDHDYSDRRIQPSVIREGNAAQLSQRAFGFRNPDNIVHNILTCECEQDELQKTDDHLMIDDYIIYVTADGQVRLCCDDSYKTITNKIGTLSDKNSLSDILEFFIQSYENKDSLYNNVYQKLKTDERLNDLNPEYLYTVIDINDTESIEIKKTKGSVEDTITYTYNGFQKHCNQLQTKKFSGLIQPSLELFAWHITMMLHEIRKEDDV